MTWEWILQNWCKTALSGFDQAYTVHTLNTWMAEVRHFPWTLGEWDCNTWILYWHDHAYGTNYAREFGEYKYSTWRQAMEYQELVPPKSVLEKMGYIEVGNLQPADIVLARGRAFNYAYIYANRRLYTLHEGGGIVSHKPENIVIDSVWRYVKWDR